MKGYTIFIQATDGSDHRVDTPNAKEADAFGKWVNRSTGAAVQIFDLRTYTPRATFGDFDESRL